VRFCSAIPTRDEVHRTLTRWDSTAQLGAYRHPDGLRELFDPRAARSRTRIQGASPENTVASPNSGVTVTRSGTVSALSALMSETKT